jgi:hypothetical protein
MVSYGGLSEDRVTRLTWRWERLRAAHDRGAVPGGVYLRSLAVLSDELAGLEAGLASCRCTRQARRALELRHRVDLTRLGQVCRTGSGTPAERAETVSLLPELWQRHDRDIARFPAHPDAVGAAVPPVDGDGGDLPDLLLAGWEEAAALLAPDAATAEVDRLADRAAAVLGRRGGCCAGAVGTTGATGTVAVAEARVRALAATGRHAQAAEIIALLPAPTVPRDPAPQDVHRHHRALAVRLRVALGSGDLELAASMVALVEDSPAPAVGDRDLATTAVAESLVPLAHVVAPEVTARRVRRVVTRAAGRADLVPAMGRVADYLVAAGEPAGAAAVRANCAALRPGWRAGRDVPGPPVPPADPTVTALPGIGPAVPEEEIRCTGADLTCAGPVDLAARDLSDVVCGTVFCTLLDFTGAATAFAGRLAELLDRPAHPDDPAAEGERAVAAYVLARAGGVGGDSGAGDGVPAPGDHPLTAEVARMITRSCCAGTRGADPVRALDVTGLWQGASPLVRRLIELDLLLGGTVPSPATATLALRALPRLARTIPRAVPLAGATLLEALSGAGGERTADLRAAARTVAAVARTLPSPPGPGAAVHADDLLDLVETLLDVGAYHETAALCTVFRTALHSDGGVPPAEVRPDAPALLLRYHAEALAGLGNLRGAALFAERAARCAAVCGAPGSGRLAADCRLVSAAAGIAAGEGADLDRARCTLDLLDAADRANDPDGTAGDPDLVRRRRDLAAVLDGVV